MPWTRLARFADPRVGKLWNLRRAARAGLAVPPTVWARADALDPERVERPTDLGPGPLIVRSAAPDEDTDAATAAGRYASVAVERQDPATFRAAVRAVRDSMAAARAPSGAVPHLFVQPLLAPERGGVAFTDGFHYERGEAEGGNRALTAGTERGAVVRGQLARGEPWSAFLGHVARAFRRELAAGANLDLEYAVDGERYVLLQVRPARFPLRTDPLLSQANHREILGDLPSPWITAALEASGARALDYFARVDPAVGRWGEAYAVVVAGRPWLNFSFFFRLMDRWGLPRSFVTEGVGGGSSGPLDARADLLRMVRCAPRLVRLQLGNLRTVLASERAVRRFAAAVEEARDLTALFDATVLGLDVALTTNFALNGALTGLVRVRRALGLRGRARVVTEELMREFDALRALPDEERRAGLARWLDRHGHRGPLESDPARPRFRELAQSLGAALGTGPASDRGARASEWSAGRGAPSPGSDERVRGGPLFWLDRRRESFRDDLMRVWERLRARILERADALVAAGLLAARDDVFLLEPDELERLERGDGGLPDLDARRAERAALARLSLPHTAHRETIEAAVRGQAPAVDPHDGGPLRGAPLGAGTFAGRVVRADDLVELLARDAAVGGALLGSDAVLVAQALEPSWAVVLGRVGAVVTELGGELSHVAILLREAGVPALLDVSGATARLREGDAVELDLDRGTATTA